MQRYSLYLIATLGALPVVAAHADFAAGTDAYQRGDYAVAAREFRNVAERGDHRAMLTLGAMHAAGQGVEQDFEAAKSWFEEAARYGRGDAVYKIALLYEQGLGVEPDPRAAARYVLRAAKMRYAVAQYRLGELYRDGGVLKVNPIKAYAWFSVAAAAGLSEAGAGQAELAGRLNAADLAEARRLSAALASRYGPR